MFVFSGYPQLQCVPNIIHLYNNLLPRYQNITYMTLLQQSRKLLLLRMTNVLNGKKVFTSISWSTSCFIHLLTSSIETFRCIKSQLPYDSLLRKLLSRYKRNPEKESKIVGGHGRLYSFFWMYEN